MIEITGDLWSAAVMSDALCLTTNGSTVRLQNGWRGVMGRGIAKQAKDRIPHIEQTLGETIKAYGNHVRRLAIVQVSTVALEGRYEVYSFPVKHVWSQRADRDLIIRSAFELVQVADERKFQRVVLPRAGCGNGGLDWKDVQPLLATVLDDRFTVVEWACPAS